MLGFSAFFELFGKCSRCFEICSFCEHWACDIVCEYRRRCWPWKRVDVDSPFEKMKNWMRPRRLWDGRACFMVTDCLRRRCCAPRMWLWSASCCRWWAVWWRCCAVGGGAKSHWRRNTVRYWLCERKGLWSHCLFYFAAMDATILVRECADVPPLMIFAFSREFNICTLFDYIRIWANCRWVSLHFVPSVCC